MQAISLTSETENFNTFCRVCLQLPEESQKLDLNLIYDEEEQLSYHDCFVLCTGVYLNDDDDLPSNLCKSCGLELQMAYDFKKKVEISKTFLRELKAQQELELTNTEVKVRLTEELSQNITKAVEDLDVEEEENKEAEESEEQETAAEEVTNTLEDWCEEVEEQLEFDNSDWTVDVVAEELLEEDAETVQTNEKCYDDQSMFIDETSLVQQEFNEKHLVKDAPIDHPMESFTYTSDASVVEEQDEHEQAWFEVVEIAEPTASSPTNANSDIETASNPRKRYSGKFRCDYCQKLFPNHSRMVIHRRSHETDRPKYPCSHCSRIYATKQAMLVHIRTVHTKTANYCCPICDKIYAIKKGLEVHMRYHTGTFPFVCDLCGKKFAQMCHLKTHKNVKHNSVRFSCEYPNCGKFFTSSASLRSHEFSHGDMPFECAFCDRGFPAKAKLKVHIRRKHGKEMTLEELEDMRKFHVMRSKLNLVKLVKNED